MIKMKKMMIMLSAMMMTTMSWAAKNTMPDVEGTILDENSQPMQFVSVALLSGNDSTYIQGATSDEDGKFHIFTPEESGILRISCLGYQTMYVNVRNANSGVFKMKEDAALLKEVTVKGQMPKTKLTGNSMITKIEGTVLGQSGTLDEMLAKVPGMTRKGDDLEVLGKGSPIYYINGRRMQDKDELKRLRSEEIKEVEVITNPGAQYDATVSAVVRIKTKRKQGSGFGYDIMANNNQDLVCGFSDPNATLNLRYRQGPVDVFGMVNYWKWDAANMSTPDQISYFKSGRKLMSIQQEMNLRHDFRGQGMNYNLGFNWQIDDNHSVGMRVERHDKIKSAYPASISTSLVKMPVGMENEKETEKNSSVQDNKEKQPYNWEGNAYYVGKFGKLGVDLNMDLVTYKTREDITIAEENNGVHTDMSSSNPKSNRMFATKLVLSYPLWKGQLQAGTEMSFVKRKSEYSVDNIPVPSSKSDVKEDNVAGFVEYACQIPKIGNLSAGLRYENVGFRYNDLFDQSKDMSRYTNDLFPSFSWSQQFGAWQASLAYSIKTDRPRYEMLDESMIYLNPYSCQRGDAKLKNAKMQEVSATVRYKWVNLFMAYERRDDALTQWSFLYNNDGVILIKNINLDVPIRNFAAFLTASPTFGVYSANWTAGVQKYFVKNTLVDPREATGERVVRYNKPIEFFDLNNAFRLKHSWQLEANMNIMLKGDVMNFRLISNSYNLRFVVQKCWLKNDALCLRVTLDDVLKKSSQKIEMDCGYYTLNQLTENNRQRLNVSLRYTFNASQSKYKGTGAGKDAMNRMKSE